MQGATAFNFDNNCWRQNDEGNDDDDDDFMKETVEINKHVMIGVCRPRMYCQNVQNVQTILFFR